MNKYYERHHPGPASQVIALPIPARLVETFDRHGIVFAPTPQAEAMSALFNFFWSAIVHFYTQPKRTTQTDAAINEAARFVAPFAPVPPGIATANAVGGNLTGGGMNIIDAAAATNVAGGGGGNVAGGTTTEVNEDGRETHFEYNNERFPYIAAVWETMHAGLVTKPAGYVFWIASWAPNGITKLISSHLKRCSNMCADPKARMLCDPRYYAIKDPLLMIRKIDEVYCAQPERECIAFMDARAYKAHEKHPVNFFHPQRLRVFFPTGWSTNTGVPPDFSSPAIPWFMQSIPHDALTSRECRWNFPIYYLEKAIAEILCNTGGVLSDVAQSEINDAIETAMREQTINRAATRSDVFHEPQYDLLAYIRERNAVENNATFAERLEVGTRVFNELPSMMTFPCEDNAFIGNVSRGQYVIFSGMDKIQLPPRHVRENPASAPLFRMVTKDLSAPSNVLLKIMSMFHDHMGVHYGNRMFMTMSSFVNNLGCPRPYVGTGLMACIGLFGPKSLGKNRAHDAAALLMNKAALLPFASVTNAIFRTDSNYNGMKMAVLETPKELLGIDSNGHVCSTPLSEAFKELLTSGGKINSLNFNGGSDKQHFRTTKPSNFQLAGSFELICNHDRAAIEKQPIGSRTMLLEHQTFNDAIDMQDADSFVDEHGGDSIESTLSAEGKAYVARMQVLFDVHYIYCSFQRMGLLPILPEESVRMVLDGMNGRLRKRGYDGYTMRVGTQMTNEVRSLSTFLAIALWWEGGLGACYRAQTNTAFLCFAVLLEISRYMRVFEDAIIFVFSQNISLVQSPLRQAVSDSLHKLLVTTVGEAGKVTVWNEHLVSDRQAPSPLTHGEESAQDAWLRENYVQLVVSIAELTRILSDQLRRPVEEIKTALRQLRDREQCVVDGIARPVYKTKGPFTDMRGYFLKKWISGSSGPTNNIYREFLDMLYKSMSMDRTTPTQCITVFPSDIVDGTRSVQVLSVPACVTLERRANVFETFTRPARSFYFAGESVASKHRTTDGEWQQRGFPSAIESERRVIIDHDLLDAINGVPPLLLEYPRGGIENALREHKERILGAELRRVMPRVMPHYSLLCDLWMPAARDASAFGDLAFVPSPAVEGETTLQRKERVEKEDEEKRAVLRKYQVVRSQHQSSMYGIYAVATACRRWCELVSEAKFVDAGTLERYISAVLDENTYAHAIQSFAELKNAQESIVGILTQKSLAAFSGVGEKERGFGCLLETLPVLNESERAYCKLYVENASLRPIEERCAHIRPNFVAVGSENTLNSNVALLTSTYDSLRVELSKMKKSRRSAPRPVCRFTHTQMMDAGPSCSISSRFKGILENVNMARREFLSCVACGDLLTACAIEEQVDAVLQTLRAEVEKMGREDVAEARAGLAGLPLACLNVQNAWGNVRLQQMFPLRNSYHLIHFDETLWACQSEVKASNALGASIADVNKIFSTAPLPQLTQGLPQRLPQRPSKQPRLEGQEHVHSDAGEEEEENAPIPFSASACWMSAYLFNAALPHEVLPESSARFRRMLLECADKSTPEAIQKVPGRDSIVTPQSLSYILFHDSQ